MSYTPFTFGAGANSEYMYNTEDVLREQLSMMSKQLANALANGRRLGVELETARTLQNKALVAEQVARACFEQLHNDNTILLQKQRENMAESAESRDYDTIIELQRQLDVSKASIKDLRDQLSKTQQGHRNATGELEQANETVGNLKKQLENLRDVVDTLKADLEHEKAAAEDRESFLNKAYADRKDAENARQTALDARDAAERRVKEFEYEFDDIRKQLEETQHEKEELEAHLQDIERISEDNRALETDIERLQGHIDDHERTLIVKDERIAHLEGQFQKERQRNLNAADAAFAAAATPGSPIQEPQQHTTGLIADSLADELDAASDDYHYDIEHFDFADIISTIDITPIHPVESALQHDFTTRVSEVASVAPVNVPAPSFQVNVNEAGSFSPIAPNLPKLSLAVNQAGSVAPVAPTQPQLDVAFNQAGSTAPVPPAQPQLSLVFNEVGDFAPITPAQPELSLVFNQAGSTAPVAPAQPELSLAVNEVANFAPITAARPELGLAFEETGNFAPVTPVPPQLDLSFNQVAMVEPVERKINTASTDTQTDRKQLTIQILESATFGISPISPVEVVTAAASAQTDATPDVEPFVAIMPTESPNLTMSVIERAAISVAPLQMTEDVPISSNEKIELAPIMVTHNESPKDAQVSSLTASATTQTIQAATPKTPVAIAPKPNKVGLLQALLIPIVFILFAFCIMLYTELSAWRTANGVGLNYPYTNSHNYGGAYGNGRYLFGVIPLAQDVGNSWVSEQVARYTSMAITGFENWAGVSHVPHY